MTVGSFCLIKNEIPWIAAHLESWLPYLDQMVFFDGNSTDGTLGILRHASKASTKVTLVENMDPKDLTDDYVRIFNACLHSLDTDYALFIHPDMLLDHPGDIRSLGGYIAYTTSLRSFAGEPGGQLYEIKSGRGELWKNIYRLRSPNLGLHYFGHYGAINEDCYFSKITGNQHEFYGQDISRYPYEIKDSGIKILHFSDVRSRERRLDRMVKCLHNQGHAEDRILEIAQNHPRVTLKDGAGFKFEPAEYPEMLRIANA